MKKMIMKQSEFKAVRRYIENNPHMTLNIIHNRWSSDKLPSVLSNMLFDQIAAAYFGEEVCEIEPEYVYLDNVQAAAAYVRGEEVEWNQDSGWFRLRPANTLDLFTDDRSKFRKLK